MDETTLRKIQLSQLSILKEFRRVCMELNTSYFLDAGTLLGAVRHKGFIPWDDDLDVGMFREDYEKFIREAPTILGKRFFLQTWRNEEGYPLSFAKLRLNHTLCVSLGSKDRKTHQGIWIDIFPFDRCDDNFQNTIRFRLLRRIQAILVGLSDTDTWSYRSGLKKCVAIVKHNIYRLIGRLLSRDLLIKYYEKISAKQNTKDVSSCFRSGAGLGVLPRSCFTELSEIQFEDDVFLCPNDYVTFLRCCYGDFMKLPPVEQRHGVHEILVVKFESE